MKNLLIILFFVSNLQFSFSMDTIAVKYFPLQTGNVWVFTYTEYPSFFTHKVRWTVGNTTVMNGHLYYSFDEYWNNSPSLGYIRIDSLTGSVKKYSVSACPWLINEITWDSLSSRLNDSSSFECNIRYKCTDTSNQTIFSIPSKKKKFTAQYDYGSRDRTFVRNFGLVSLNVSGMTGTYSMIMDGCILNGVMYGDTSLVGFSVISETASEYSLMQSYPNPFNPDVKIQFAVSKSGNVKLTVIDILGREVEVLQNRELKPGLYKVDWNASSFPSGVYYYRLEAENFSETKKMVLIK